MLDVTKVKVDLSDRTYDINIGQDILNNFGAQLINLTSGRQVILISNDLVYNYYGQQVKRSLERENFEVLVHIIPEGEEFKNWQMAGEILSILLEARFNRDAVMVALGGGVIGDLAGFVAAVYQRGIDFVQIPTTLLAQVDSSVGGKVAVNHPLGKNMIGAFHQPLLVWADLDTLVTLPEREWLAGLAEVVKYGVIWDEKFFYFLENNIQKLIKRDLNVAQKIISHSCAIKARIVSEDEKEQGLRAILNFGHTIGHAIEKVTEYKVYRHGETVAMGMVAATQLAINLNLCSDLTLNRLKNLLEKLGLPVSLPPVSIDNILDTLLLDKKVRNKKLVFVLPRKLGQVEIVKGINGEIIKKCLVSK
ncbi:MAG: 3-dehydroquinate synthase [Clostridia bacterium]|jgi:3-dehydroquinate synthase|nr:3-dehydroquinate synthase [Clostridia bacterium]MDN5321842.1 3-dehydroquinate synthase [Clostridia bacterium]